MTVSLNTLKVLPNDPIFKAILQAAKEIEGPIITSVDGFQADYNCFLRDLFHAYNILRGSLPPNLFNDQKLLQESNPYICVLGVAGYRFIVIFYAILALGGACIILAPDTPPEDVDCLMGRAGTPCLVSVPEFTPQVRKVKENSSHDVFTLMLPTSWGASDSCRETALEVNENIHLLPTRPAFVMATSGTTGAPKAIVHSRRFLYREFAPSHRTTELSYRPPYWIRGLTHLVVPLIRGYRIHILPDSAPVELIWNCIRDRSITRFFGSPLYFARMRDCLQQSLSSLPQDELARYISGIQSMEEICNGASMIDPRNLEFWRTLCGDVPISIVYGSTEAGGTISKTPPGSKIENSLGTPIPGVCIRLSEGHHGEVLLKSPTMFSHFLGDEQATIAAFDEEGYYKTGDLAHRIGDEYVFDGRAVTDFVHRGAKRISCLELENSLLKLPYICEAYVIAVPERYATEIVAAIVRPKKTKHAFGLDGPTEYCHITLAKMRKDLSAFLPSYKLPAMLRILEDNEEIPRAVSGKPIKKGLLKRFFNIAGYISWDYSEPSVECWNRFGIE